MAKSLIVAILVAVLAGHWTLLQTAAWVSMTIDYSQKNSLAVALQKTFDGKHPCGLCRLISKETKAEKERECKQIQVKLEFLPHAQLTLLAPPSFPKAHAAKWIGLRRPEPPLLPPPRPLVG